MHPYVRAAGFGAVAGLRSMTAPAALASGMRGIRPVLIASALGELIADKLPIAPSRLAAGPLGFRLASGAYTGWRATRRTASPLIGAVLGGLAALSGAYLGHALRRFAVRRLHLPDPLVAIAEDLTAVGAVLLLRREH